MLPYKKLKFLKYKRKIFLKETWFFRNVIRLKNTENQINSK